MKKVLIPLAIVIAMVIAVFALRGGGTSDGSDKLIQKISVESIRCGKVNDELVLKAEVRVPPYSAIMMELTGKAEEKASSAEDFGKVLYSLVLKEIPKDEQDFITTNISVNLSEIDAENAAEDEAKLEQLAKEKAFEEEISRYCMEIVRTQAPPLVLEEVEE